MIKDMCEEAKEGHWSLASVEFSLGHQWAPVGADAKRPATKLGLGD